MLNKGEFWLNYSDNFQESRLIIALIAYKLILINTAEDSICWNTKMKLEGFKDG